MLFRLFVNEDEIRIKTRSFGFEIMYHMFCDVTVMLRDKLD